MENNQNNNSGSEGNLEEVEKRLYSQNPEFQNRPEAPQTFAPGRGADGEQRDGASWQKESLPQAWQPKVSGVQKRIIKLAILGAGVAVILVAAFFFWRSLFSFDESKVVLTVFGPDRLTSGEEVTYVVRYKNGTKVNLTDVKVTFIYPPDAIPTQDANPSKIGSSLVSVIVPRPG